MGNKKEFWVKITAGIIFGLCWIGLIGWKIVNPEINLKNPLIIAIIISIFSVIAFFGNTIYSLINKLKEEELPEAINSERLREIINKEIEKMWNMLKIENPIVWVRSKTINKNIIYAVKLNLIYDIKIEDENYDSCIIIINANYPEEQVTIIKPNVSEQYIDKRMNDKSKSPLDEPEREEHETIYPTGEVHKFKKTIPIKKEEKKEDAVV